MFRECGAAPEGESSDSPLPSADLLGSDGPTSSDFSINSLITLREDGPSAVDPGPNPSVVVPGSPDIFDPATVLRVEACSLVDYDALIPSGLGPSLVSSDDSSLQAFLPASPKTSDVHVVSFSDDASVVSADSTASNPKLPPFSEPQPTVLVGYVDAAHATDLVQ